MATLTKLVVVLVCTAGCMLEGDDEDDRLIVPTSATPTIDTNVVTGRVCRVFDIRDIAVCNAIDVANLTIEVGGATATTLADGTFAITAPQVSTSVAVNGATVTPTLAPFSGAIGNPFVPVVDADVFARVFTSNGLLQSPTSGSVLTFVTRNGVPVQGVFARTNPASTIAPIFDGLSTDVFTVLGTGPRGVILAPGLAAGGTTITLTDASNSFEVVLDPIRVLEGGVTIVNAQLP